MAPTEPTRPTEAVEDYAKAIHPLQDRLGGAVPTMALAERVGVTPGSASAMVKRLAERGLVAHVPYHGVALTPELGLSIGHRVDVVERAPFDGPVTLRVGSATHAVGGRLAHAMWIGLDEADSV